MALMSPGFPNLPVIVGEIKKGFPFGSIGIGGTEYHYPTDSVRSKLFENLCDLRSGDLVSAYVSGDQLLAIKKGVVATEEKATTEKKKRGRPRKIPVFSCKSCGGRGDIISSDTGFDKRIIPCPECRGGSV
jgi:hypothetical protein